MATPRGADRTQLQDVFDKYASIQRDGKRFMSYDDFYVKFLGILPEECSQNTLSILGSAVGCDTTGRISFDEFCSFEKLLLAHDALYKLTLAIFDYDNRGTVKYGQFTSVMEQTVACRREPYNFKSGYLEAYFGANLERPLHYAELTQLLYDFRRDHSYQAFRKHDNDKDGTISMPEFVEIISKLRSDLLTPFVSENLPYILSDDGKQVSYAFFSGFCRLFTNMELVKKVYLATTGGSTTREITKEEFQGQAAHHHISVTALEVDILFRFIALLRPSGKLVFSDLETISPFREVRWPTRFQLADADTEGQSVLLQIGESAYKFGLGSIAGAIGATAVYPIDLVKTRMQNQRTGSYVGELMYKNSIDCFRKVLRFEGVRGLYRGLGPQLIGVAPEKAIKLTMNDLVRGKLMHDDGTIDLWAECVAGGTAGGCQVMFTNPLEIVKIRLQVAGEITTAQRPSAITVVKELGFFGLYKGARACLLRDIPFSAIYFPAYANMKKYFSDSNGYTSPGQLLLAATLAGAPAASLTTPADVIKTRLQVVARSGQTSYSGLLHCARTIMAEEGPTAFWKGAVARMMRSSPQFGVTLLMYESLQRWLYVDFGGRKLPGAATSPDDLLPPSRNADHVGGYRFALSTFDGIERRFGLVFPKYKSLAPPPPPKASS